MERVVIDTNILVSAIISPKGNPAQIMMLVSYKELQLFYCSQILDEYKRVLATDKWSNPYYREYKTFPCRALYNDPCGFYKKLEQLVTELSVGGRLSISGRGVYIATCLFLCLIKNVKLMVTPASNND